MKPEKKKYLIAFLITTGIFIVVFGLVNFLNNQKLANIDDLQRKITADLIATETQFELLKNAPCKALGTTILSRELGELGLKLDFAQETQGADDVDVIQLKKYYSLLQVKDYLLMQEVAQKCDTDIESLLYFYTEDCDECRRQGYILTEFKKDYPELRIYSFDGNLEFSVIDTFASLYNFNNVYPTLIIGEDTYQGFTSRETLEDLFAKMITEHNEQKIIDTGALYILGLSSYSDIYDENIIFTSEDNDIYTYSIETLEYGEVNIQLEYDIESEAFSFK